MNRTAAEEWMVKVWHNYSSAKILFDRVCNILKINLSKIIDDQNSPDERTFNNKSDD